MLTQTNFKKLYELDSYLWLEKTIEVLKTQNLNDLDIENLIDELENLGKRGFNKVRSLLRQIIIHVLLLEYWTEEYDRNHRHWEAEILAFRWDFKDYLTTTLRNKLDETLDDLYDDASKYMLKKTGLANKIIPMNCPYSFQQLSDKNWYPHPKV